MATLIAVRRNLVDRRGPRLLAESGLGETRIISADSRGSSNLKTAPLLFADEELPWRPVHDPVEVRDRLEAMLVKMRAAARWPWKPATLSFYRETLWPALLGKLPHAEAARLRCEMEAEITRLDLAG